MLIYIPEYMPFPNIMDRLYIESVTAEIDRLLKVTYGHALVLFTSYRLMELVFNSISGNDYGYPLFIMGRGRIDALHEFKLSGNGVLFASDTAGEGIDIAGDTLSNLIIVKLPFDISLACKMQDDGYSGANFNRPHFQKMIDKITKGEIDCVIVKDL